ncbi:unnamed protein product [Caenorhabditis auriculariae]|uniref:Uncharacterized protein n=1 Tax=Caenorhabditis auriculariae TaxID=2777116 RepID=A0A8S1HAX1_9PELO|nr:unnamed protein product [Caenorhabditis auriculariae]
MCNKQLWRKKFRAVRSVRASAEDIWEVSGVAEGAEEEFFDCIGEASGSLSGWTGFKYPCGGDGFRGGGGGVGDRFGDGGGGGGFSLSFT